MIYGIDTSFDTVDLAKAQRLRAAGIQVAWQCLYTGRDQPSPRVINLRSYQQAGLFTMGYISLPTSAGVGAGRRAFDMGRAGVPDDLWQGLFRVVTDVELPGIQPVAIRELVEATASAGKLRTIYTSLHAWADFLGNDMSFGDCDVINAFWDRDVDRDFDTNRYGPWSPEQVIGEQYTGGEVVLGVYADRDVFYVDLGRLLGRQTEDPRIGLLQLRVAVLEGAARGGLNGDGQLLVDTGRLVGGRCS